MALLLKSGCEKESKKWQGEKEERKKVQTFADILGKSKESGYGLEAIGVSGKKKLVIFANLQDGNYMVQDFSDCRFVGFISVFRGTGSISWYDSLSSATIEVTRGYRHGCGAPGCPVEIR